jgi:hypothetical protein
MSIIYSRRSSGSTPRTKSDLQRWKKISKWLPNRTGAHKLAITYDRNTDYQKKINQAAAIGDKTAAAVYEAQRNAKIQGEGLTGVSSTNNYAKYLPDESVIKSITGQTPQASATAQTTPASASASASAYRNPYQGQLDKAVDAYLSSRFSYDQDTDPAAQAYRENYINNGQLAMDNTLAQVAARTGGLASSYAGQAAQQTYNTYMQDLNAQLANLRQQAFENYLSDQSLQQNRISTLSGLASQAENSYYNRISDAMNRWATLGYADDTVASVLGVPAGTPTTDQAYQTWSQNFQQAEFDQTVADTNRAYASDLAYQMLATGLMPDDATLQAAGISKTDATALYTYYNKQRSLASSGSRAAAGGAGGGTAETERSVLDRFADLLIRYDFSNIELDPITLSRLSDQAKQIMQSKNSMNQRLKMLWQSGNQGLAGPYPGTVTDDDLSAVEQELLIHLAAN